MGPPSPSNGMSAASLAIAAPSFVSARAAKPLSARRCQRCTQPAPPAGAGGDHEPPVGLAHRHRGPVAGEALGRGAADRIQHAVEIERHAGQQAGGGAHAVGDRSAAPQGRAMRRVELGGGGGAHALEHASRCPEQSLGGLERRARDLRAELHEGTLQRTDERDEAEPRLDAARDLALQDERRERRAVRIAQRALERLQCLLGARPHARERHAFRCEHLVRDERAAFEQRRPQLRQEREPGRLGLGSLVDHGASIGCLEPHGLPLCA